MAILASIEVDENDGSLKIRNFKDALSDLGVDALKSAQNVSAGSKKTQQATQEQASALSQLVKQHRDSHAATQQVAQGYGILQQQLRAGTTVTDLQAKALQQLATQTQSNTKFSTQFQGSAQALAGQLRAGTTVTAQQASALQGLTQQQHGATNGARVHGNSLQELNIKAAAVAASLGLVAAGAYSLLRESGDLAARVETLGVVMGIAGKNANLSTHGMKVQVESVKALGITTQEANDSIIQFTQAQLKLADASKIARAAQDLAVVAGENSSQTFKRLTTAIQIQQPILLRQVGITTGLEQIYREYAQTLGKNWQQLDALEKKQAFVNKILAEGEKVAGAYEASMTTAGKQIGSFSRFVEEAKLKLGQGLLPVMLDAVKVGMAVLNFWIKLPEPVQRTVTALMAAAAAMLMFTAALAGAKFVGIVSGFATLATNINYVIVAARNGIPVMTAFMGIMGPMNIAILAVVAAVGLATAAYVYFRKEQEIGIDKHLEAAAALDAEQQKILKTSADYEKAKTTIAGLSSEVAALTEKKARTRDEDDKLAIATFKLEAEQGKYNRAVSALIALAPSAVRAIEGQAGAYDVLTGSIKAAVNQRRLDMLLELQAAKIKLGQAEADAKASGEERQRLANQRAAAEQALRAAEAQIASGKGLEASYGRSGLMITSSTEKLEHLKDRLNETENAFAASNDKVKEAEGVLKRYRDGVKDLELATDPAKLKSYNRELAAKEVGEAADQYKNLAERLRVAGKSADYLTSAADPATVKERLDEINAEWDKHSKKVEENQKKYTSAFNSALDNIRSTGNVSAASLAAVDKGLGEVGRGTDEYAARVMRAREVIGKFNTLTAEQQSRLQHVAKAVEDLKLMELDKEMEKWERKAKDVSESFLKMSQDVGEGFTRSMHEFEKAQGKSFEDTTRQTAEKVLGVQRELSDNTMKLQRSEVEQRLMENGRYFQQFRKNIDEEIRLIRLRHTEEVEAIEQRAEAARREVMELARRTVERFKIEYDGETAIAKARDALRDPNKTAAQKEAELRAIKDGLEKTVNAYRDTELAVIDNATRASVERARVRAAESEKWVDALKQAADQSHAIEKDNAAAIQRDQSLLWQHLTGLVQNYLSMFLQSFASILTGAKSFKDVFIDIWQSIKNSVFGVLDSILQKWIQNAQRMAAAGAIGPNGFSAGGGMAGFFGGLAAPFSKGQQVMVPGMNGGSTMVGLTKPGLFQTSGLAGGALAAGAGGLVGYGLGGLFNTRTKGALAGAAGGAATGAMMGMMLGPLGAGAGALIGGAAGLLGGLFSGGSKQRAEAKAVAEARKELMLTFGQGREGLEKLREEAAKADFDITRLLSTKKTKEFEAELKKLNEAIGLKKGREELIKAAGGMEALQKQAQLLGFNIDKVLNEKTLEGFNRGVEELNKALEAQQKRLEGLGTAAEGIEMRVTAMQMRLARGLSHVLKLLPDKLMKDIQNAFEKAQSGGFKGGLLEFMLGNVEKFKLDKEIVAKLKQMVKSSQAEFARLGGAISATFAGVLRETGDIMQAMSAIGPSLDALIKMRNELGLKIPDSLKKLIQLRNAMSKNEDIVMALSGIVAIVKGLGEAGMLTQQIFNDMGRDAATQFKLLRERGVSADMALLMMQPTLQALYEAQKKFGFETDKATQKLIDMAKKKGLVGDQFKAVDEKILEMLVIIAKVLGADIPEAYRTAADTAKDAGTQSQDAAQATRDKLLTVEEAARRGTQRWKEWGDAAVKAGRDAEEAMGGAAEGHSPTGIKQVVFRLRESRELFRQFKDEFVRGGQEMEQSATDTASGMSAATQAAPASASGSSGTRGEAAEAGESMAEALSVAIKKALHEVLSKAQEKTHAHVHLNERVLVDAIVPLVPDALERAGLR